MMLCLESNGQTDRANTRGPGGPKNEREMTIKKNSTHHFKQASMVNRIVKPKGLYFQNLNFLNNKIRFNITSHFPVSARGPGPQLLLVSGRSITVTLHLPAFSLATVLHQVPDLPYRLEYSPTLEYNPTPCKLQ